MLRGRPTLRTPEGERELAEGEVVAFPPGRGGAHQLINATDEPVRYLMVSHERRRRRDRVPRQRQDRRAGRRLGRRRRRSRYLLSTAQQVGYFDGEPQ